MEYIKKISVTATIDDKTGTSTIVMHITNTSTMAADEAHLFRRECLERS
ncbi:MAG: hypothetical protein IKQ61_10815 [Spirochaetales bacterium]|nr:hypothetical protein [Spirochaetales bacterium]MBR6200737.1 hypothetical protein [Spirochaetales bacterium]